MAHDMNSSRPASDSCGFEILLDGMKKADRFSTQRA